MKLLSAVAAATLLAIPINTFAAEFSLDLSRIDVDTDKGRETIRNWIEETAVNHCGPTDMPQPLDLQSARANCQAEVRAEARIAVERALDAKQGRVSFAPVVASR